MDGNLRQCGRKLGDGIFKTYRVNTTNVLARVLDIKRWLVTGVTNLLHIELVAKYVVNLLKSSIYTKLLMEPQFLLTTKTFKRWFLTQDY